MSHEHSGSQVEGNTYGRMSADKKFIAGYRYLRREVFSGTVQEELLGAYMTDGSSGYISIHSLHRLADNLTDLR